ncbi:MAG: hypothetical protein GX592_05645 [Clostridiales bacterium]|nr:hypothetical protein [Clostridiales bacterium]
MKIYYLLLEGRPSVNNEESEEVAGAYINCWIKAKDEAAAKEKAIDFVTAEGWDMVGIEEICTAKRERYADLPDSLECYEQAIFCGIGVIFYTWPIDAEDRDVVP